LRELTVDGPMNIEVTSVSKEPERLADAAAAIHVVTSDEILLARDLPPFVGMNVKLNLHNGADLEPNIRLRCDLPEELRPRAAGRPLPIGSKPLRPSTIISMGRVRP